MRLWTIDPSQLDSKGLVALWREGLLAQAVLDGNTNGYKNHPQLDRWQDNRDGFYHYMVHVWITAISRGYKFDNCKIVPRNDIKKGISLIPVTSGQIDYEVKLLQSKLDKRSPGMVVSRKVSPIFVEVPGDIEPWEKVKEEVNEY